MESVTQESRGRRSRGAFGAEFKRTQIERLVRGQITAAELSRGLGMARLLTQGGETAAASNDVVVPASEYRAALGDQEATPRAMRPKSQSRSSPRRPVRAGSLQRAAGDPPRSSRGSA